MNIMEMMKKAQELQSKMGAVQAELDELAIEGQAGAGLVIVTVSGKGEVKGVKIDPSLMKPDEVEILEDLIVAAASEARSKSEVVMKEKMQDVTGGLPLPPGMKLF